MSTTKIEWVKNPDGSKGFVWNPVTGCSKVSRGCEHCYAESLERRFRKDFKPWTAPNATHNVRLHPDRLGQPLSLSKPRRIFVNSVSDLFHDEVPDLFISSVLSTMALANRHTYMILTKRAKRMSEYFLSRERLPISDLWLGISAEDQPSFDERSKYLLRTPATKRFVSLEPLLGPIQVETALQGWREETGSGHDCDGTDEMCLRRCPVPEPIQVQTEKLDWVIVGGESGAGPRPMHPDWVRSVRDQCQAAGVPFFFKQWGAYVPIQDRLLPPHCELMVNDDSGIEFRKVGKKAAGNWLDGRTWEEYPS